MNRMKEEEVLALVQKDVKTLKGLATAKDLAARSGIPIDSAATGLERMMELFNCRVSVRQETGEVLFRFEYPLRKRGSKTLREKLHDLRAFLWKIFVIVYKASIGIVLLTYFLIFVAILIGAMFSRGSDNDDRDNGPSLLLGAMFRALLEAFVWSRIYRGDVEFGIDSDGMRYRRPKTKKEKGENKFAKFIKGVYAFVFGPERPEFGERDQAREVAAFVQKNHGKLTSGQLIALTGWTYDEAETRLADYLVKFKGSPEIEESGTVVGEFPQLEDGKADESAIVYYQDETEAPYELTGNGGGLNAAIVGMNLFNLAASGYLLVNFDIHPLLGIVPLIYSALFFLIPLARIPLVKRAEQRRHRQNIRRKIFDVLIAVDGNPVSDAWILQSARIPDADHQTARDILGEMVIELQGEISLNDQGQPLYTFPRLWRELQVH